MASPCCWRMSVVALLWLCLFCVAAAATVEPNKERNPLWELPVFGPTCDLSTPVCGEGGIDFENACDAIAAGVPILESGVCGRDVKQAASCSVKCFRADPVCDEDAVTYWCGAAEAKCAGVEIAYTGYCDPRSGGAGKKGTRAAQSLFLVHLLWLVLAGFLVIADLL